MLQGNLQTVGQERDKDVGFNPLIGLVIDRADCEIPLQFLERLLHLDQLQEERPELRRIATRHVRPQQILPSPRRASRSFGQFSLKRNVSGVTA